LRCNVKKIQILGTGCPKCKQLTELVKQVADEMHLQYELEKVTQISDIMKLGVMITPGLVVDGVVKVTGKVPSASQIREILSN
jgi:small redox-active disulfide protein 2